MTKAEAFLRECAASGCPSAGSAPTTRRLSISFWKPAHHVTACDRRSREQLGAAVEPLEQAGARLLLGDGYLDQLTDADLILRTPGMKPYLPAFEKAREAGIPVTSEMELFSSFAPRRFTR